MADDLLRATHTGKILIGEKELSCAVLEDGTRVLPATSLFKAFGRSRRGKNIDSARRAELPRFLESKSLKPYVDKTFDGGQQLEIIQYKSKIGGNTFEGYRAEILPIICEMILSASENGDLVEQQQDLAVASLALMRSFARLGIVALIDEATGYQFDRERDALQKLLSTYVAAELLPWTKTFPDEFYSELFRLRGWDYKGGKNRSPYVGKLTNYLVYDRLPREVVDRLKELNPVIKETGHRKHRLFQNLTKEIGYQKLISQIATDVAMMRGFDTWDEFNRVYRKSFGITEILPEDDES